MQKARAEGEAHYNNAEIITIQVRIGYQYVIKAIEEDNYHTAQPTIL